MYVYMCVEMHYILMPYRLNWAAGLIDYDKLEEQVHTEYILIYQVLVCLSTYADIYTQMYIYIYIIYIYIYIYICICIYIYICV